MENTNKIQKKRGRGSPEKTRERRERILRIIEEVGFWNINKRQLAEMFDVNIKQIYKDIEYLMKHHDLQDIKKISFLLSHDLIKAQKEIRKILNSDSVSPAVKLQATSRLMDFTEKFTKFLEAYGIKEKVADKIEIVGQEDEEELLKLYNERIKKQD